MKNSFEEIYDIVRLIPDGRITTYGAIAKFLKMNARTVGWAMYAAEGKPWLPAHRVVNHKGILSAAKYFINENMEKLLRQEGIVIVNNKIKNFKRVFWDPSTVLKKEHECSNWF